MLHKIHRVNSEKYQPEQYYTNNFPIHRSPIRRQTVYATANSQKSPIRSRSPIRNVSPIKNVSYLNNSKVNDGFDRQLINKYITNVSPLRNREQMQTHFTEHSNGKNAIFNQQTYLKSERTMKTDSKLFGKLISNLNSEKKSTIANKENSYQTSMFTEQKKIQKTSTQMNQGSFKNLINHIKTIDSVYGGEKNNKSQYQNSKKVEEDNSTHFQTYKIKPPQRVLFQEESVQNKNPKCQKIEIKTSKKPEILQNQEEKKQWEEEESDYSQIMMYLNKIKENNKVKQVFTEEAMVQMSLEKVRVKDSLDMNAFL